jgi:hypothetical protein
MAVTITKSYIPKSYMKYEIAVPAENICDNGGQAYNAGFGDWILEHVGERRYTWEYDKYIAETGQSIFIFVDEKLALLCKLRWG